MNRAVGLPILICVVIIAALAAFLSYASILSKTYAQSAYPLPGSSVSTQPLTPVPYPAPEDVTTKPISTPTEEVITVEVSITVTVDGLVDSDTVELQIVPDTGKTTSSLQVLGINLPKISFRNEVGRVGTTAIPVGTYKLIVFAPDSYFREPQGYLFQLTETGIVNHSGAFFHFNLIPPSAQDLPPCRDTMVMGSSPSPYPAGDIPFEE